MTDAKKFSGISASVYKNASSKYRKMMTTAKERTAFVDLSLIVNVPIGF